MKGCIQFLEGKLKLKVNREKSAVGNPLSLKFLGFRLYKKKDGKIGILVHERQLERLKDRLKAMTSRRRSGTMERILEELTRLLNGWVGYYRIAELGSCLEHLCGWLRRRIRQIYWKRWKRGRTRYDNLIRLGVPRDKAWQWANTRKGSWRIAGSWILQTTLNNHYLETLGFPNMSKRYEELRERARRREILHGTF